jgi:alpha-1,3-mannosyltransferase
LVIAGREWDLSLDVITVAAQAQGLAEAVHCIRSPSDPELRELIAGCSFFVSFSSFEGFGIAAVEALSAGLFPILSDIPPFRDFVARTGHGVLVDVARLEEAATTIEAAAESYEAAYGRVRPALEHAADVFAWPSVAAAYAEDYRELLRASRPS